MEGSGGEVSLWYDNFLGTGLLFEGRNEVLDENIKIQDLVVNDRWNMQCLQLMLGS